MDRWKLGYKGNKFTNGKGTVREVVEVLNDRGQAKDRKVRWKKIQGRGPEEGTVAWASWRTWAKDEWLPPRPDRLPLPEIDAPSRVFATNKHAPPLHWVPDEFRDRPGSIYDNTHNPWCKLANGVCLGFLSTDSLSMLPRTLPDSYERYDAQRAWDAVMETLGSWGMKHETKMATCAYMFSEWFEDYWLAEDSHTRVKKAPLVTMTEDGVEHRIPDYGKEDA